MEPIEAYSAPYKMDSVDIVRILSECYNNRLASEKGNVGCEQRRPRLLPGGGSTMTTSSSQASASPASSYYHSVQRLLSHVTASTIKEFRACESDEARVAFVISRLAGHTAFTCTPLYEAKSAEESKRYREQGNVHYQSHQYKAALVCYSKSVIWAPHPADCNQNEAAGSEELALALGNRSATLYQLRRYEEAVVDMDLAFKYRFPAHIQYKLYDRKGRCLLAMGDPDAALVSFNKVKEVLSKAKLTDKQRDKIVVNSNMQISKCRVIPENEPESPPPHVNGITKQDPQDSQEIQEPDVQPVSKRFPCASSSLDVKYTATKGRHVVGASNVTVGWTLMKEAPYAAVLDPALCDKRCFHCFRYLDREAIPCQMCVTVRYCSETCRETSWEKYHQWECRHLGLLAASGTGYIAQLALRTVITAGMPLILKCKRNKKADSVDAQKALFTDSKGVYVGGFVALYTLLPHTAARSAHDLLQYAVLAVFLTRVLEDAGFTACHGETADSRLGGVLLRLLQIISCNGVEVCETVRGATLQKCNPESIGLALYPTVSLFNHSCNPAVELVFYNNTCCARAIRNMAEGEELTIDYGYIYYVTPKAQRQMYLKSQYFFDCQCEACQYDWPLKASLKSDIPVLKCVECFTPLSLFGNKDPTHVECRKCRLMQNPLEYFDMLRKSSQAFEKALELARIYEITESLPVLEDHLIQMDSYLHQPWKEYATCVSTIKQCYRLQGNVRRDASATRP